MPLNVEEVLIRVLTNADQARKEFKELNQEIGKTGTKAKLSGKDLLKIASAFGGITLAVDLAVKAVVSFYNQQKKNYDQFMVYAQEYRGQYSEILQAETRYSEAIEKRRMLNGQFWAEASIGIKESRANWIEYFNTMREHPEIWKETFGWSKSFADQMRDVNGILADQVAESENALTAIANLSKGYAEFLGYKETVTSDPGADKEAERRAKAELARLEAVALASRKWRDQERQNYRDWTADKTMAEQEFWEYKQELEAEATAKELEHIEEIKRARELAMDQYIGIAKQGLSAISTLVSNRYQAEADSAERGSDAQKEALRKQFNANKAFSIVDSILNTAVAVTKVLAQGGIFGPGLAVGIGVLGALQTAGIASQQPPSFATGTSPSGFTVPNGYESDNFPVQASTGERVTVERPGQEQQQILYANLSIDGYSFGKVITRLFEDRKAVIKGVKVA